MADGAFNEFGRGSAIEIANDGAVTGEKDVFMVLLLKKVEVDSLLNNHSKVSELLLSSGNTEANFTNYERKLRLLATVTVDDTNDRADLDLPDQTWISAGGLLDPQNNDLKKVIIAWNKGLDGTDPVGMLLITFHDLTTTTNGGDLEIRFNASGFFRSQ